MGCILYELAFKKLAFWNINNKIIISNITGLNYNLPDDCEKDLKIKIPKLICEESKRLTIKDIFLEGTIKNKIIEINLFPEITKGDEQGKQKYFYNYRFQKIFSLSVGIFEEKESLNKFRTIEINEYHEYPFYLFCPKCGNSPPIKLIKLNEIISMSCFKCNINMNERFENIVNYSSKLVTKDIKLYDLEHKEKISANIYCKNHNLFLCKDCLKLHKETNSQKNQVMPFILKNEIIGDLIKPTSDDIINSKKSKFILFCGHKPPNLASNLFNFLIHVPLLKNMIVCNKIKFFVYLY